jgi:hypothetical protein
LLFFEPRYRLLIRTLMDGYRNHHNHNDNDNTTTDSDAIMMDGPSFIYASATSSATSVACIVQVQKCQVCEDGWDDVTLVPTHYVWMERVWKDPSTGRFYQGRCLKMGVDATQRVDPRQRGRVDMRRR